MKEYNCRCSGVFSLIGPRCGEPSHPRTNVRITRDCFFTLRADWFRRTNIAVSFYFQVVQHVALTAGVMFQPSEVLITWFLPQHWGLVLKLTGCAPNSEKVDLYVIESDIVSGALLRLENVQTNCLNCPLLHLNQCDCCECWTSLWMWLKLLLSVLAHVSSAKCLCTLHVPYMLSACFLPYVSGRPCLFCTVVVVFNLSLNFRVSSFTSGQGLEMNLNSGMLAVMFANMHCPREINCRDDNENK